MAGVRLGTVMTVVFVLVGWVYGQVFQSQMSSTYLGVMYFSAYIMFAGMVTGVLVSLARRRS